MRDREDIDWGICTYIYVYTHTHTEIERETYHTLGSVWRVYSLLSKTVHIPARRRSEEWGQWGSVRLVSVAERERERHTHSIHIHIHVHVHVHPLALVLAYI